MWVKQLHLVEQYVIVYVIIILVQRYNMSYYYESWLFFS